MPFVLTPGSMGPTPCQQCQRGLHRFQHTQTCTCSQPGCSCMWEAREEVTPPWPTPALEEPAGFACTCDMRIGGCTCPVGQAELEAERAKRRERDKNRLHYI